MSSSIDSSLDRYLQAGRIAARLRPLAVELVKRGASLFEICMSIEEETRRLGGKPAFPVNVCIGSVAAHFTAPPDADITISEGDLVKVDFGVMVDGFIVDTAVSINLSPIDSGIVRAAEECLEVGIREMKAGTNIASVGEAIQKTAKGAGYKVITNLTGHEVSRYNLHAGGVIPNVAQGYHGKVKPNTVYAIEPFLTYSHGAGVVVERAPSVIFRLARPKPREKESIALYSKIFDSYRTLPFAERWLELSGEEKVIFKKLIETGCISKYPQLVEKNGVTVVQAEHTVAVLPERVIVLTR
ncbi:MAG: type II methionyl aminopeptidase [Thermoproteota archaeon]